MTRINGTNARDYDVQRLLQEGVYVRKPDDVKTVSDFVRKILQLKDEQFTSEIKTIFINSRVVDDPEQTTIHPGDVLVLSGAMPGLVGAMFRSDSPLKSMRASITSDSRREKSLLETENSMVCLKMFNTVLRDYKQKIVAQGFWLPASR